MELASSRAEVLLLHQRVDAAEAVARQNKDDICQRQTLEHVHSPMLRELWERANTALGIVCEAAVGEPHVVTYACNIQFFTDVVTQLEVRSGRADRLVEERSRALFGRGFSRVFIHLQHMDPHFDFDASIAAVPLAVRDDLARWVEDNVDALVRAFTTDDDGVVVATDEGGVVNGTGAGEGGVVNDPGVVGGDVGGDGEASDASGGSGGVPGDALGDLSD